MGNSHAENCQLVGLACQCAARWYHVTQFVHVRWHFVTSSSFDFTMTLPNTVNNLWTTIGYHPETTKNHMLNNLLLHIAHVSTDLQCWSTQLPISEMHIHYTVSQWLNKLTWFLTHRLTLAFPTSHKVIHITPKIRLLSFWNAIQNVNFALVFGSFVTYSAVVLVQLLEVNHPPSLTAWWHNAEHRVVSDSQALL